MDVWGVGCLILEGFFAPTNSWTLKRLVSNRNLHFPSVHFSGIHGGWHLGSVGMERFLAKVAEKWYKVGP